MNKLLNYNFKGHNCDHSVCIRPGLRFFYDDCTYVLSMVASNQVAMIDIETGTRWRNMCPVKSSAELSYTELLAIIGKATISDWFIMEVQ